MSRLQPTGCLPPALAGGPRGPNIEISRLQPGFSACQLMSDSISRKTWLEMVETFLHKPAEAGSSFGGVGPAFHQLKLVANGESAKSRLR